MGYKVPIPLALFVALALLCTGTLCLFWPHTVQQWAIVFLSKPPGIARWNPFLGWVRTPSYLIAVRFIGALSMTAAGLVAWALVRS